jgi:4-hydroxybenzoate polyprenyltransferase
LTPLLLGAGFAFGLAAGGALYILAYVAMTFLYSLKLKHYPLVDIFSLAGLYSLRLFAGGEVSGHEVSFWLLGFSSFLFLSLAGVKRVAELRGTRKASRGYEAWDRDLLQIIGVGSSLVSANLLALYVQSDTVSQHYANPRILWAIVPLLLLWQCRLWLSTTREYMHDDPIVYAAKDWVSWLIGLALALVLAAGFFRF